MKKSTNTDNKVIEKVCSKCDIIFSTSSNQSYCKKCRKIYNSNYYEENREKVKAGNRKAKQKRIGNYVYFIMGINAENNDFEILYIGSCSDMSERMSNHFNGHSNLERTWEEWKAIGLCGVNYIEIEGITMDERECIEKYFIQSHETLLNSNLPPDKVESEERRKELIQIAEKETFKVFSCKKINSLDGNLGI